MIEKYFEDYTNKYYEMKKALKRYIEAKEDYYHLTGISIDDMPKGNKKPLGFDDLLGNIEKLNDEYIARNKELEEAEEKCKQDIRKLKNPIHRAIIEYAYLNFESNKDIAKSLNEYHNKNYTLGYVKVLKLKAVSNFNELITKYNLI